MRPDYGAKIQYIQTDNLRELTATEIKYIQHVIVKFLFMTRAVDNTLLHALNELACQASKRTQKNMEATKNLLNYIACNSKPRIMYHARNIILLIGPDAAYLVCPKARSQAGGYHYPGNKDGEQVNMPVLVLAKIIKNVISSAAESEVVALSMNAKEAVSIQNTLKDMGHNQPSHKNHNRQPNCKRRYYHKHNEAE